MQLLSKKHKYDYPMTIVFLISCLLLFYTVAGYPLLMMMWSRFKPDIVEKNETLRPLSVVLCVRDEAKIIAKRISNLLKMDYPQELLEIIVVSDGSVDDTDKIVQTFKDSGVSLICLEQPAGKAVALHAGILASGHEMLLLCDARQHFAPDVARKLIACFSCLSIGAVSGRLSLQPSSTSSAGEGVSDYWNYEVLLRSSESKSGSVIGVTGAIYMLRKSMYTKIPAGTVLDDVLIPMRVIMQGGRVLYEKEAVAYDSREVTDSSELTRKIRTLYGNLQLFQIERNLFLPWKNPAWFRFISHKIMRLLLPFVLASCFFSCLFEGGTLLIFGVLQILFWIFAVISIKIRSSFKICTLMGGFLLLNVAVSLAWYRWITGKGDVWKQNLSQSGEGYS